MIGSKSKSALWAVHRYTYPPEAISRQPELPSTDRRRILRVADIPGSVDPWAAFLSRLARKSWIIWAEADSNRGTINLIVDKRFCPPYSFLELLIC